jgi:Tfp pilus assembly protein PilP
MSRTFAIGSFVALWCAVSAAAQAPMPSVPPPPAAGQAGEPAATVAPAAQGYTNTAEGRRDPFVTLVKRGSDAAATTVAARAAGLAGLNTGEVRLRGILASQGEHVAMLLGSDDKTYIVRSGDKLADGTINAITADSMVILQQVHDPLSSRTQREVRKMLRQIDGTN